MGKKRVIYTPEFKKEVCEFALHSNISNASKFYNLNRITVSKWIRNFDLLGEDSFTYRKKREDRQKVKLDQKTILKIKKIKDRSPGLTNAEIKEKLNLDCDVSLISRKLGKLKNNVNKINEVSFLNIYINVLSQTVKYGEVYSLYQINITDNNSNNHFIGFSSFKDNTNLCVFMDYILSNIQGLEQFKNISKIKTNLESLDQQGNKIIFNRFIKDKYGVDLEFISKPKFPKNSKLDYVKSYGIEDLFHETYKKLITEKSIQELESNFIIPPIFIDDFIQDANKIISFNNYWNVISLPKYQRNILTSVIEEIEKLGDMAKISFDFENALELYNKVYLTSLSCENVDELKANSLLKQADIYYHLDNFSLSKEFYNNSLIIYNKLKLYEYSAKTNFYLGMISYILARTKEADNYFNKALNDFELIKDKNSYFEFHQTFITKNINSGNLDNSLKLTNKLIKYSKRTNNRTFLAKGYGILGNIYYIQGDFRSAKLNYLRQEKIAKDTNNVVLIIHSLRNSLSIYINSINPDKTKIDRFHKKIIDLSKEIKKESYIAESNYKTGLYNYNQNKLNNAETLFRLSCSKYKLYQNNYIYFENLYYLGKTLYLLRKYSESIEILNELIDLSHSYNNHKYLIYCYNILGKIYYSMKKSELSIDYFNSCIELGLLSNNNIILAGVNKNLGNIYKEHNEPALALHYYSESLKFYNLMIKNNNNMDLSKEIELIKKELSLID
ncbi:MAG: hypothetical protein JXR69_04635 [Candidatus Delongbacteria bacterium]|nr:hypothetical protein [Candidatus Delongbacteria bacterium]